MSARKTTARKTTAPARKVAADAADVWKALTLALASLGIKRGYLNDVVLPSWWQRSVTEDRNGFLETVAMIHRRTGLPLDGLLAGNPQWAPAGAVVKFKKATGVSEADVRACHTIARQAAEAVASAVSGPPPAVIPPVEEIHALLKERGTKPWVCLEEMVAWCWEQSIAVIHVDNFPAGCRKPDGMAVRTRDGCPVIVLCRASKMPAWQIFTLAHELGHIALGHVPEGGAVVDSKLEVGTEEQEEQEANRFACTVLTGQPDMGLSSSVKMYPSLLAKLARQFGQRYRISPGVVALNWAFNTKEWATANGAVKILEGNEDAVEVIRKAGAAALDWQGLSADSAEWLERMAGLRPAP